VVISGGDGTVLWVVEEALKAQLNFDKISFGILPIGTGNDFSRSLGWGHAPLVFSDKDIKPLKKRLIEWVESAVSDYDIWEVKISTYRNGDISFAKNKEDFWTGKQEYQKSFSNYLGLGVDARVTYAFEMNRQSTRCCNMMVYACCGLANLCKSIQELKSSFSSFRA
jgi:diacylglycerol kinase (ATP)